MEHIEEAGVHSGDSACAIPPQTLSRRDGRDASRRSTRALADALDVRGLLNVQYAVKDDELYVIEANPRASRTVPFVSKATGVPLAKVASRVMVGATLAELRDEGLLRPPAERRPRLGEGGGAARSTASPTSTPCSVPRCARTGEVMGIDRSFGLAFAKSQTAAGNRLPRDGHGVPLARRPRQGRRAWSRPAASPSSASASWRPPAPPRRSRPRG